MRLDDIWNDPVWSKVIGGLIVIAVSGTVGILGRLSGLPKRFWQPTLRKTHGYVSDQSETTGVLYPLKYYIEAINDSRRCIAVRVADYAPSAVTLQKFVPDTLQAMMPDGWHPKPNTTDSVALLPNQRCRAWVGIDATKFTKNQVETLEGKIGTLTLTANGKKVPFVL
jgi:hypothetical protein